MRLSILWKPLLTQYTLSEAHRNAQCVGSIPDSFIYPFFRPPSNTLKPTLFIHQQAPELRKETSLLFFGHLNQHLQAFHTDPPG